MKSGLMATSTSQHVSIELESPSPPLIGRGRGVHTALSDVHRTHSRSASWSLPGGHGSRHSEFGMGLASLNPIAPITNVIREIVPSFGSLSQNSDSNGSLRVSRNPSQSSLLLGPGGTEVEGRGVSGTHESNSQRSLGDSGSNMNVQLPHEHTAIPVGGQGMQEEQNTALEMSDGFRWLEQNVVFVILLLVKFAWYHRSGWYKPKCLSLVCVNTNYSLVE